MVLTWNYIQGPNSLTFNGSDMKICTTRAQFPDFQWFWHEITYHKGLIPWLSMVLIFDLTICTIKTNSLTFIDYELTLLTIRVQIPEFEWFWPDITYHQHQNSWISMILTRHYEPAGSKFLNFNDSDQTLRTINDFDLTLLIIRGLDFQ
jgi:hypothetical protein